MNIFSLAVREVKHRFGNFMLAIFSISISLILAVICFAQLAKYEAETNEMLNSLQRETESNLNDHQVKTNRELTILEDNIRKSMKGLGYNVYLFSDQEDISLAKQRGYAETTLDEQDAKKLADSKVLTINHLLPQLARRVDWQEKNKSILLVGVAGQVPMAHRSHMKPIMDPLEKGTIILGHDLHAPYGIKVGDSVELNGKVYKVAKTYPKRSWQDDGTAWIHLSSMQDLTGLTGKISSIKCLGCNCASDDRVAVIREEISTILPHVAIVEDTTIAEVRAKARVKTSAQANKTREAILAKGEKESLLILETREASQQSLQSLVNISIPAITVIALTTLFILSLINVRHRREEIGILKTLGVRPPKIISLFLIRALIIGCMASAIGLLSSWLVFQSIAKSDMPTSLLVTLLTIPPLASLAAAWIPVLSATLQPAINVLRHD